MPRVHQCRFLGLMAAILGGSCAREASKPAPPATVSHAEPEGTMPTVTLTDEAIARLGLVTAPVEERVVSAVRTVGGEVVAPPGWAVTIAAPAAGRVARDPEPPPVGSSVEVGQLLLRLIPIGPQADAVRIAEDIDVTLARAVSARAEAERVRALHRDGLASTRELERAEADFRSADATARAAAARQAGFEGTQADSAVGTVAIRAPQAGRVTGISVGAGTTVASGAPLIEVLRRGRLWVRVSVFAGDQALVDRTRPAAVRSLRLSATERPPLARPVSGPPSADLATASVDIYYEFPGDDRLVRPGERVEVALPLQGGGAKQLVVPWSAIVRDAQGGAWVYQRNPGNQFVRRAVMVRSLAGEWAVLDRGPPAGTVVVSVGVAELFGTEFGTGK